MKEIIEQQRVWIIGLSLFSLMLILMLTYAGIELNSLKKAYNRKLRTTTLRQRVGKMFKKPTRKI